MVFGNTPITGEEATGMRCSTQGRFRLQALFLRRQFLQDGDLPFTNVLTQRVIEGTVTAINICRLDRSYSSLVTLWVFSGQVFSADHYCRADVVSLYVQANCIRTVARPWTWNVGSSTREAQRSSDSPGSRWPRP